MKKISVYLLSLILLISFTGVLSFSASEAVSSVTSAKTPVNSAKLLYSKSFGANYKGAPTTPVVADDTLIVVSGVKLYKLDVKSGKELQSIKMAGSTLYGTVSPVVAEGKIFVQLDGGIVQAFDYESMESLWIYTDALEGQALCPIIYDDGYVYTGFWNGETDYANYVCLNTTDENTNKTDEQKSARWAYKSKGGFYWAGCVVNGNYVVLGKDDGKNESTGNSKIVSLNKKNGKSVSTLTVKGDVRSAITYDSQTKSYYTASKSGYVYKFSMNTSNGKLSSLKSYKASGAVTATPIVYNGRLYTGCQKGTAGEFIVLDCNTMSRIYTADMLGYPQGTMLVSNGYEAENGKVYVYSTYNKIPGGITVFEDSPGQTDATRTELYAPPEEMSQYCVSGITAGNDGTLYYKNDSGNIFAVGSNSGFWYNLGKTLGNIIVFFINILKRLTVLG